MVNLLFVPAQLFISAILLKALILNNAEAQECSTNIFNSVVDYSLNRFLKHGSIDTLDIPNVNASPLALSHAQLTGLSSINRKCPIKISDVVGNRFNASLCVGAENIGFKATVTVDVPIVADLKDFLTATFKNVNVELSMAVPLITGESIILKEFIIKNVDTDIQFAGLLDTFSPVVKMLTRGNLKSTVIKQVQKAVKKALQDLFNKNPM